MSLTETSASDGTFLAFVQCAGCGDSFSVHSRYALAKAKWCSEHCRKMQYQRPCATCGKPCGGSDKSTYCAECGPARGVVASRERWAPRRELIEQLWRDGKTLRQICETLEIPYVKATLARWRQSGYDLPYRRSGQALANIRRASADNFALARAARKAAA